jgi:hypothetical protein
VNSTEVVAIIGAGSTLAVAVAGYAFNYYTAGQLARDAHQHERELADAAGESGGTPDQRSRLPSERRPRRAASHYISSVPPPI